MVKVGLNIPCLVGKAPHKTGQRVSKNQEAGYPPISEGPGTKLGLPPPIKKQKNRKRKRAIDMEASFQHRGPVLGTGAVDAGWLHHCAGSDDCSFVGCAVYRIGVGVPPFDLYIGIGSLLIKSQP